MRGLFASLLLLFGAPYVHAQENDIDVAGVSLQLPEWIQVVTPCAQSGYGVHPISVPEPGCLVVPSDRAIAFQDDVVTQFLDRGWIADQSLTEGSRRDLRVFGLTGSDLEAFCNISLLVMLAEYRPAGNSETVPVDGEYVVMFDTMMNRHCEPTE